MSHLPNLITLARILIIPLFVGLMIYGHTAAAFAVFIVAGISDALDGFIARAWKLKTSLGAYLDPIADKLLLTSSFLTLSVVGLIPIWATVTLVSRDILLVVGVMVMDAMHRELNAGKGSYLPRPTVLGKITTASQLFWITAMLFLTVYRGDGRGDGLEGFLGGFLWVMVFLTVFSGLHYVYREVRLFNHAVGYRTLPPAS